MYHCVCVLSVTNIIEEHTGYGLISTIIFSMPPR